MTFSSAPSAQLRIDRSLGLKQATRGREPIAWMIACAVALACQEHERRFLLRRLAEVSS